MNGFTNPVRSRFVSLFFLSLLLLFCIFAACAEAGVTLRGWRDINPNVTLDGTAATAGTYEYVLFGNYPQDQTNDTPTQPILWRVLSADQSGAAKKALLFSDKNLDAAVFDLRWKSPANSYGTAELEGGIWNNYNNNYAYSQIREFLVGYDTNGNFAPDGGIFANASYFSASECSAVSVDSFESVAGRSGGETVAPNRVTLNPLFLLSDVQLQKPEFGFRNGTGADVNRVARNTVYAEGKGAYTYSGAGYYWTRSPVASYSDDAWDVYGDGALDYGSVVHNTGAAVRPALFLNLESLIFKSGSDLASPPAAEGGKISNPYILYLDTVDQDPNSASVNGGEVTITFAAADKVVHAYTGVLSETGLAAPFAVTASGGAVTVTSAAVDSTTGTVTLRLSRAIGSTENVTVSYANQSTHTDGLAFASDTVADRKALDTFTTTNFSVTNATKIDFSPNVLALTGTAGTAITPQTITAASASSVAIITSNAPAAPSVISVMLTNASTGEITISGTPNAAGSGVFGIEVEDANNDKSTIYVSYSFAAAPAPSDVTTPTGISVTIGGTTYRAELQTDGTYLITLPAGSNLSALPLAVGLPAGATISPALPGPFDFTNGPLSFTITAADGTTTGTIQIAVVAENPAPTERAFFTVLETECEIRYVRNEDGTVRVEVLIPLAAGSDPALLDAIRATITGLLDYTNVSYSYVNEDGAETPIPEQSAARGAVQAPYLKITFTMPRGSDLDKGLLTQIDYTLKNDATEYVQTFPNGGLKFSAIEKTDATPGSGGSSGVGCEAGFGAFALLVAASVAICRKNRTV